MGVVAGEFEILMARLTGATQEALRGIMYTGLLEALQKAARERVYSYAAAPYMLAQRRYMIADESNVASKDVIGTTLQVKYDTHLQIGESGEIPIVEEGVRGWYQPGARPFMEYGLSEYAGGRASGDLVSELQAAGFDAYVG